ncbi:glycosyl hydrolase family protein [Sinirhodobacter populi]|uniref:Glycosyl hydrolase family protein n=1 Tax=Paenirhodobacter populi TaxID=2306993 RepID=A0A443KIM1_9RHOB|nr:family 16 glycosylhydrolase [Sinirhodobacter populi]RWR32568.1 glycosyl hydrolase family protein [Sinirhodobacter populi]
MVTLSRRGLIAAATATLAAPALVRTAWAAAPPADPVAGRSLVFEDSFTRIDRSIWDAGPKAGTADPGHYGRAAFARFGGEERFDPYAIVDDPLTENGKALQISARYIGREMNIPNYWGNSEPEAQWVGGNLQTAKSDGTVMRSWRRGYFEARMIFPEHPLTWPAFWLLNDRVILQPETAVELDIVEHKGFEPKLYGTNVHEWGPPEENHAGTGVWTNEDLTQSYNLYGMLVEGDYCATYFNRRPVIDMNTGQPAVWTLMRSGQMDAADDGFWLLLTLALRADYPFPDPLLPEHHETHMRVDNVRVYA